MELSSAQKTSLDMIVARHGADPNRALQVLIDVQDALGGWLAPAVITRIAQQLGLPRARIEGVAGFYSFLHLEPAGRYRVLFSDNITDRMLGNEALMTAMCEQLWVERGRTSEDGLVSIDMTSCTGMCDQGPAILVNGWAIPNMTRARVEEVAELIRAQRPVAEWPPALFAVADNIRRSDLLLGSALAPGDALRATLARGDPGATLEEIKRSKLRGRGGAGFSTGLKWEACAAAPGDGRVVVCNADEGEPGTFKDRVLLARQADLVFEGMTVCAWVVGAQQGFVYLRGEYRHLLTPLNEVLARRRRDGLLGTSILGRAGFDFDIEIHLGAGAYVCGEESALIESLEGKRGIPRNRPPYPVTHGYLGRPTTVNNVETFCAAAMVALKGGDGYAAIGTPKSAGTKLLSVAGDCARPGIYEYPFGVSVREVLADCGADDPLAVQVSGPSGSCIDASELDRRIAFEDLPTAGAFMVFDGSRDMFEVARNFAHFFAHESCGFCTPCRVGTSLLRNQMDKLHGGKGSQYDLNTIYLLNRLLQAASHCGLGHTACNPIVDTLKRFKPVYERRLQSLEFEPAFDLDGALARAREMTGRTDPGAYLDRGS
jgi:[NiFe] hydrogenase diaphorase moiety large subunit